uniref:BTB domain-containing protein n=1 Tax=Strongyloides papillosus TaxID=174720 RepID=A0A0N5BZM1_STREA
MDENRKILFDDLLINAMFDKLKNMWGIKTYISKNELLKECVKDIKNTENEHVFFIGCKVYYYYNEISDNKNNFLSNALCVLLNTEKFSDCILKCGEKEFKVHKCIISCRSNILNKLLTDMKDEGISRIEINSYSEDSIRNMLSFMYTNEVASVEKNPIELLKMSHEYEIKGLKEILE